MENDTPAAVTNTNNNGTTVTAKAGSVGVKLNNHGQDEEHSNFNGEEHMVEKVEENGEEEDEDEDEDEGEEATRSAPTSQQPSRTPFTNLSQVDADLALARTLQEQVSLLFSILILFFLLSILFLLISIFHVWFGEKRIMKLNNRVQNQYQIIKIVSVPECFELLKPYILVTQIFESRFLLFKLK